MRAFRFALALALSVACLAAFAQTPGAAPEGPEITRADLAAAYQRIDRLVLGSTLPPEQTAEINKGFDQATLAFFQRRFGDALKQIDAQTAALLPADANKDFIRRAAALRVRMEPPVVVIGASTPVTLHIEQLYLPGEPGEPIEGRIELRDAFGEIRASEDFKLRFEKDRPVDFAMALRGDRATASITKSWLSTPGRYTIWIASDTLTRAQQGAVTRVPGPSGQCTVVVQSLDAVREANAAQLETIAAASPALEQALASVKARNTLLTDTPSPDNTAQFVLDPTKLAKEIGGEVDALKKGEDPFKQRRGDYWRVLKTSATEIPLRVYAPASLDFAQPVPLVVAFHGAGGDENMFMDAYGAGIIKQLADKHGFLLVSPLTYSFNGTGIGASFDALLDALGHDYTIDLKRIYVLGHSMGGGATTALVVARGARIAAASPICGFRGLAADAKDIPPMLVIAAEHDPLAQAKAVGDGAAAAKAAGFPVEYKLMPNYGHTLVIGEVLPEVVDWLLAKSRP
jgi:predicted esterase